MNESHFLLSQEKGEILVMSSFIKKAAENDPYFKEILFSRLYLKYNKALNLPVSDIILGITSQYNLIIRKTSNSLFSSENNIDNSLESALILSELEKRSERIVFSGGSEGNISLSKLFPSTGTEFSMNYSVNRLFLSSGPFNRSSFSIQISQNIARNAFGRITRKQSHIIGIETELARYQAIEAYEEYLASLMALYLDWYSTYENIKAAQSISDYAKSLHALVKRKRRYRIALAEDVYKIHLQELTAKETLVTLKDKYRSLLNDISETAGLKDKSIIPKNPRIENIDEFFTEEEIAKRINNSRTLKMLNLLNKKGILTTQIAKHNLLPSASFFTGYAMLGRNYTIESPDRKVYAGLSLELSFGKQKEKAAYAVAQLDLKNEKIKKENSLLLFRKNLFKLYSELQREKELIDLFSTKLDLAKKILKAERQNYNIGKATLNELITAQNNVVSNQYDNIYHKIYYQKLLLEWRRLTDTLIQKI